MGAHKDRLIQAAELLGMTPDELMERLNDPLGLHGVYGQPFADGLLFMSRRLQATILDAKRVDSDDARSLARVFRELDIHLSAGGIPPEAWREGPDAPDTGEQPDREPSPEQEHAWDLREDDARGNALD